MKKNYHWILLGIAVGIVIYLIDKYKGVNVDDQNDLKFLKIAFKMKRKK